MVSSVCGGNQVRSTKCLAYSQAWWWECHGLGLHECCRHWGATVYWGNYEYQHVLRHTEAEHDPPLRRLGCRAIFQHNNDHCLAKEFEGKGDGLAKHVSRPKPYWASVGHPKTEGGGAQGLWHPPTPWCRHGGVEEDSSGNLWSSGELRDQEG